MDNDVRQLLELIGRHPDRNSPLYATGDHYDDYELWEAEASLVYKRMREKYPIIMVHVCCYCGRQRNSEGVWVDGIHPINRATAPVSDGICEKCFREQFPEEKKEDE